MKRDMEKSMVVTVVLVLGLAGVAAAEGVEAWSVWPVMGEDVFGCRLGAVWCGWELYVEPRHDCRADRYEVRLENVELGGTIAQPEVTAELATEVEVKPISDARLYLLRSLMTAELGDVYGGALVGRSFCGAGWEYGGVLGGRLTLSEHVRWALEGQYIAGGYDEAREGFEVVTGPQIRF